MRIAITTYEVSCDTCESVVAAQKGDPLVRNQLDAHHLFREQGWVVDRKMDHKDICPDCRKKTA